MPALIAVFFWSGELIAQRSERTESLAVPLISIAGDQESIDGALLVRY